jgi:hypothetical protein
MALVAYVVALTASPACADLCALTRSEPGADDTMDLPDRWQECYVDHFLSAAPEHGAQFWGWPNGWDTAPLPGRVGGDDIDRWWYVYLDRGRYRFLDETQYALLDGPGGWWWRVRYRAWLDAVHLSWSVPARAGRDTSQVIPEPGTAAFLALGSLMALATRRRRQPRQAT